MITLMINVLCFQQQDIKSIFVSLFFWLKRLCLLLFRVTHMNNKWVDGINIFHALRRTTCERLLLWHVNKHDCSWTQRTAQTDDTYEVENSNYKHLLNISIFLWRDVLVCINCLPSMHQGIKSPRWAVSRPADEDRLTRRKSFVDTISLQVDIISNSLPDKVSDDWPGCCSGRGDRVSGCWFISRSSSCLIRLCLSVCSRSWLRRSRSRPWRKPSVRTKRSFGDFSLAERLLEYKWYKKDLVLLWQAAKLSCELEKVYWPSSHGCHNQNDIKISSSWGAAHLWLQDLIGLTFLNIFCSAQERTTQIWHELKNLSDCWM